MEVNWEEVNVWVDVRVSVCEIWGSTRDRRIILTWQIELMIRDNLWLAIRRWLWMLGWNHCMCKDSNLIKKLVRSPKRVSQFKKIQTQSAHLRWSKAHQPTRKNPEIITRLINFVSKASTKAKPINQEAPQITFEPSARVNDPRPIIDRRSEARLPIRVYHFRSGSVFYLLLLQSH